MDLRTRGNETDRGPSADAVEAIVSAGGEVTHIFNAPMVRVVIEPSQAASLVTAQSSLFFWARIPADANTFTISVIVVLDHPPTNWDIQASEAQGLSVEFCWTHAIYGYAGTIDDARLPALRALPGVSSVGLNGYACAD